LCEAASAVASHPAERGARDLARHTEIPGPRHRAAVILALTIVLALVAPGSAHGQEGSLNPDELIDYGSLYSDADDGIGFSSLGGGAQSTTILSIPISIWMRRLPCCGNPITPEVEGRTVGIRLRLTSIIGLAQFDEIADFDVNSVDLGAVLPGIELLFQTGQRSVLRPYVDVGWAATNSKETTLVFGEIGLRTEFVFPWKRWELGLEPRLRAGYSFTEIENADLDSSTISAKMDARYPLGFTIRGQTPDVGLYLEPSWHPNAISFTTSTGEEEAVHAQLEVGATLGFRYLAPMLCGLFRWPRLGIGYRFGGGTGGLRIRIGGDRVVRLPLL
jgi:hypothetical protein